ncbi:hypothetical protein EEB14_47995 [Rhodococcus sp. WS4]|nr:hypothetical protein EEB14_47995 [Rhodococcus sp. WS4]
MKTLAVGDVIPEHHVVVRADAMKPMALLLRDPNPIHWDAGALRALGLDERPINQGPLNVSYTLMAHELSACRIAEKCL